MVIHPNQVALIVADQSGSLYFWDLRRDTSETFAALKLDISEYIVHVDINRSGDILIGVTNRGKRLMWSLGPVAVSPSVPSSIHM